MDRKNMTHKRQLNSGNATSAIRNPLLQPIESNSLLPCVQPGVNQMNESVNIMWVKPFHVTAQSVESLTRQRNSSKKLNWVKSG